VDAPRHQLARGHPRLTAGTPGPSSSSTRPATALPLPIKRAIATEPLRSHDQARHRRQYSSNQTRPLLAPSQPWTDDDAGDPSSAPQPPPAPIKGGLLLSIRAHHSLPLLTTALLATSIRSISHHPAPIASSPPPPVHGARRRRRPPQDTPLLPG
jgi:hypothetical protein